RLTVRKFKLGGLSRYISVKVENQSDSTVLFYPQFLSLVNKGNEQVNTELSGSAAPPLSAVPVRKVLPGAFLMETYGLDHCVELPARLYYDGRQLAVITE